MSLQCSVGAITVTYVHATFSVISLEWKDRWRKNCGNLMSKRACTSFDSTSCCWLSVKNLQVLFTCSSVCFENEAAAYCFLKVQHWIVIKTALVQILFRIQNSEFFFFPILVEYCLWDLDGWCCILFSWLIP